MQIIKQTTTTVTTTSGGGGSSSTITRRRPTPETFQLVIPGIAAIYDNGTVEIPISLKNTWGSTISGIKLSANASQEDLEMTFEDDLFLTLENGIELETTLLVKNYRVDAPLQINVSAYIESLSYTDTSTIYVNALESSSIKSLEDIQTRISFARDLLTDNPECQELTEILNNAEKKIDADPQHVWETINSVINGCKYLISESSSQTATPKSFLGKIGIYDGDLLNFNLITTIFTVLSFIAIIFGIIVKIRLKSI